MIMLMIYYGKLYFSWKSFLIFSDGFNFWLGRLYCRCLKMQHWPVSPQSQNIFFSVKYSPLSFSHTEGVGLGNRVKGPKGYSRLFSSQHACNFGYVLILPIMSYSFLISFFNTSSPFARHYFVGINLLVTMSAVNMHKVLQCISSHYVIVIFCFSLLCVQCCCLNTNSIGALSI